MTGITFYNVKRVVTPEAGNSESWFLCSAHHIMVIYICIVSRKHLKQFSSYRADDYITEITNFNIKWPLALKVG